MPVHFSHASHEQQMPPKMWPCDNVYSPFFNEKQHGIGHISATCLGRSLSITVAAEFVLCAKLQNVVVRPGLAGLVEQHSLCCLRLALRHAHIASGSSHEKHTGLPTEVWFCWSWTCVYF